MSRAIVVTTIFLAVLSSLMAGSVDPKDRPVYDAEGRLTRYVYADGSVEFFTYDTTWRIVKFVDRKGVISKFVYLPDGSVTTLVQDAVNAVTSPAGAGK